MRNSGKARVGLAAVRMRKDSRMNRGVGLSPTLVICCPRGGIPVANFIRPTWLQRGPPTASDLAYGRSTGCAVARSPRLRIRRRTQRRMEHQPVKVRAGDKYPPRLPTTAQDRPPDESTALVHGVFTSRTRRAHAGQIGRLLDMSLPPVRREACMMIRGLRTATTVYRGDPNSRGTTPEARC